MMPKRAMLVASGSEAVGKGGSCRLNEGTGEGWRVGSGIGLRVGFLVSATTAVTLSEVALLMPLVTVEVNEASDSAWFTDVARLSADVTLLSLVTLKETSQV